MEHFGVFNSKRIYLGADCPNRLMFLKEKPKPREMLLSQAVGMIGQKPVRLEKHTERSEKQQIFCSYTNIPFRD